MVKPRISLDVIEIESPCEVPWESMEGDDRVRFCGTCRLHVFDLSALDRAEAEELVASRQGNLCAQIVRRADGTVVTADCTPIRLAALRKAARRSLVVAGAIASAVVAGMVALGAWLGDEPACATTGHQSVAERIGDILPFTHKEPPRPYHPLRGRVAIRRD